MIWWGHFLQTSPYSFSKSFDVIFSTLFHTTMPENFFVISWVALRVFPKSSSSWLHLPCSAMLIKFELFQRLREIMWQLCDNNKEHRIFALSKDKSKHALLLAIPIIEEIHGTRFFSWITTSTLETCLFLGKIKPFVSCGLFFKGEKKRVKVTDTSPTLIRKGCTYICAFAPGETFLCMAFLFSSD